MASATTTARRRKPEVRHLGYGRALAAAGCAMILAFAGGARADDEVRRVTGLDFGGVVLIGDIEVEIRQGPTCELELRGDRDDLEKEPFYLSRDRLVLGRSRGGDTRLGDDLRFRVVLPELRELQVKGSGKAYVREFEAPDGGDEAPEFSVDGSGDIRIFAFRGPMLRLNVRGSGDLKAADLEVESLKVLVSGSGDLFLRRLTGDHAEFVITGSGDLRVTEGGSVRDLEVSVIGSGDASLEDLASEVAEVNVVGSGSVILGEVQKALSASVLGSGDIRYAGDPAVDETAFGSGEVRRRR
jgi:hypothetical protein